MTWTVEKLEQIPEVYRDFMKTLKPVIDTRAPEAVMKITGIPFGMIYDYLSGRHHYGVDQLRQVARNLRQKGLVNEDSLGFFTPTEEGEQLIQALTERREPVLRRVPPLPDF